MLTAVDRAIIDLERTWWALPGPKEWAIAERVGLGPASYYERLAELLEMEASERYDPLTVRRLRRLVAPASTTAGGM